MSLLHTSCLREAYDVVKERYEKDLQSGKLHHLTTNLDYALELAMRWP